MAELTDNCPMPTGKFKGNKMEDVPAWYLLWLYDQNMCPQNVKNYIDENRQVLEQENKSNGKTSNLVHKEFTSTQRKFESRNNKNNY